MGIPVAFAIFRLAEVMPSARFQLKDKPGILNFFFAIRSPQRLCKGGRTMTFKDTGHAPKREELIKEAISVIMELNETQIICSNNHNRKRETLC